MTTPRANQTSADIACVDMHDLGGRTVRGGAIVFGSMLIQKILGLAILAVMARLLTPRDFGLLGMVFALTVFLGIFADMGLPMATVQKAGLTHLQVSTMFWVNLVLGMVLGGVTAAAAPAIAHFYREPLLASVTLWCAVGFPLAAFGAQHSALLQRRMAFGRLATSELAGILAGGTVGIYMALKGAGVYALVGQLLAGTGTTAAGNWLLAGWVPGLPRRGSGVRGMLRFGGYLTAFNFVNYFARNLDNVLLGRFWGAAPLGLYTRAYSLMTYPIGLISSPMGRIMIPALSKLQDDLPRMRDAYLRVLKLIGIVNFPLMVGLLLTADDVVTIVFGGAWSGAVPIFRILCVAGITQGIYNAAGQVFVATGRTDRLVRCGVPLAIGVASSFAIGIWGGAVGVAAAYTLIFTLGQFPYLRYCYATIGLPLSTALRSLAPAFAASVGMGAILCVFEMVIPPLCPAIIRISLMGLLGAAVYVTALAILDQRLVLSVKSYITHKVHLQPQMGNKTRAARRTS